MKFLPLEIYPRLFAVLALCFTITTIVRIVTHELAHYTVAECYGINAKLHYAATSYGEPGQKEKTKFDSLYKANEKKILAKEASPEKEYFLKYRESLSSSFKTNAGRLVYIFAGPLQTMITGSIAIFWLWYYRKTIFAKTLLSVKEWFAVFIAFFWSRQIFNALSAIIGYISNGSISRGGDEAKISLFFNLPVYTVNIITGLIGFTLLLWVTFYIIRKQQRFSFILAGTAGSALGYTIWMQWIGPVVLP